MDVSCSFWDFVRAVSSMPHDELKSSNIYQRFEYAAMLNRSYVMDETSLLNISLVKELPRGVAYNYYDNTYSFEDTHALMFGTVKLLEESKDLKNNPDAQEKLNNLQLFSKCIDEHILTADMCMRMSRTVFI